MSTNNSSNIAIKASALVILGMLVFIAGLVAIISGSILIDYNVTNDRAKVACLNSWDKRFKPEYHGDKCSVLQRGYRIPTSASWRDVAPPDERDY